ncbi:MAG: hypothetical protein SFV23_25870 [Planctomycetaceae bacterium]|nr:hypothetical protein [Planctomycetaceae bacterium]
MSAVYVTPDDLFRERVLRARAMTPSQRLMRGLELFDEACAVALSAIRSQNPQWTDAECRAELTRRINIERRLQDAGLYFPVEDPEP